jgi:hypothetical protein
MNKIICMFFVCLLLFIGVASAETVTVSRDGTGTYNCDGVADQVQINQALAYIDGLGGGVVYLKDSGASFIVNGRIEIGDNTHLTGDIETELTLIEDFPLPISGLSMITGKTVYNSMYNIGNNIEISNLTIDMNRGNQVYFPEDKTDETPTINIRGQGFNFHNLNFPTGLGDFIKISNYGEYEPNINIHDNYFGRAGHCGVYITYTGSTGANRILIHSNVFGFVATNTGIRLDECSGAIIEYNTFTSDNQGDHAIYITYKNDVAGTHDNEIRYNTIHNVREYGILLTALVADGVIDISEVGNNYIHHNLIYNTQFDDGNGGGINVYGLNALIESNTIVGCEGDGISTHGYLIDSYQPVTSTTGFIITARNNIIANQISSAGYGYGINNILSTQHTIISEYNLIYGNALGTYNGANIQYSNDIYADPLFVSAVQKDFHVKSEAGHWSSEGWVLDTVTSPGIDAGKPISSYASEPIPNGERLNVGRYGATVAASKSIDESVPQGEFEYFNNFNVADTTNLGADWFNYQLRSSVLNNVLKISTVATLGPSYITNEFTDGQNRTVEFIYKDLAPGVVGDLKIMLETSNQVNGVHDGDYIRFQDQNIYTRLSGAFPTGGQGPKLIPDGTKITVSSNGERVHMWLDDDYYIGYWDTHLGPGSIGYTIGLSGALVGVDDLTINTTYLVPADIIPAGDIVDLTPTDNIKQIIEALTAGQTARLGTGTYVLPAGIDIYNSGTEGAPITITNMPGEFPIITLDSTTDIIIDLPMTGDLDGADYIEISNISFYGGYSSISAQRVNDVHISNCISNMTWYIGIGLSDAVDSSVTGCTLLNNGHNALMLTSGGGGGSSDVELAYNHISKNPGLSGNAGHNLLDLMTYSSSLESIFVHDNYLDSSDSADACNGIYMHGSYSASDIHINDNMIIEGNIGVQYGYMTDGAGSTISGNTLIDIANIGIFSQSAGYYPNANVVVSNNSMNVLLDDGFVSWDGGNQLLERNGFGAYLFEAQDTGNNIIDGSLVSSFTFVDEFNTNVVKDSQGYVFSYSGGPVTYTSQGGQATISPGSYIFKWNNNYKMLPTSTATVTSVTDSMMILSSGINQNVTFTEAATGNTTIRPIIPGTNTIVFSTLNFNTGQSAPTEDPEDPIPVPDYNTIPLFYLAILVYVVSFVYVLYDGVEKGRYNNNITGFVMEASIGIILLMISIGYIYSI